MTIDVAWLSANAWWLFLAGAAAWYVLGKDKNPLAGFKLPPLTVKLTDEQLEQLKPKG